MMEGARQMYALIYLLYFIVRIFTIFLAVGVFLAVPVLGVHLLLIHVTKPISRYTQWVVPVLSILPLGYVIRQIYRRILWYGGGTDMRELFYQSLNYVIAWVILEGLLLFATYSSKKSDERIRQEQAQNDRQKQPQITTDTV